MCQQRAFSHVDGVYHLLVVYFPRYWADILSQVCAGAHWWATYHVAKHVSDLDLGNHSTKTSLLRCWFTVVTRQFVCLSDYYAIVTTRLCLISMAIFRAEKRARSTLHKQGICE